MKNYDTDPQMGAQSGEAVWMIGRGIEAAYKRWKAQFPDETRGETMDRVHNEIEDRRKKRPASIKNAEALDPDTQDADAGGQATAPTKSKGKRGKKPKKGKKGGKEEVEKEKEQEQEKEKEKGKAGKWRGKKDKDKVQATARTGVVGGAAGKEMWHRVITEPVMMEMLLSTKACLLAYTPDLMGTTYVSTLLQPCSGIFAAEFWLAVETLLKVSGTRIQHFTQLM